jgi:hypothetical protein
MIFLFYALKLCKIKLKVLKYKWDYHSFARFSLSINSFKTFKLLPPIDPGITPLFRYREDRN